jgi:hypothetical protein
VFLKEKLQPNERMNLLLKVYIDILLLFLTALLKKRAHAIPYESNQYEIVNDTLHHFFQPRSKKKTYKNELIKQIALPETLRNFF